MWKGLINNDVDAAFATTITGPAKEAETSPRGLVWPPLPHNDKAGWERVQKVGSFFFRTCRDLRRRHLQGKADRTRQLPLPDLRGLRHAARRPGLCHHQGDDRRLRRLQGRCRRAPVGLAADRQTKNWVVPVHPGAVKALKEAGQWTDEQEAHNNALLKRQEVLAAAWADYGKSNPPSDDKEFLAGWMKARAAALAKANMPNGFEE